jgi:hypothetical protein
MSEVRCDEVLAIANGASRTVASVGWADSGTNTAVLGERRSYASVCMPGMQEANMCKQSE